MALTSETKVSIGAAIAVAAAVFSGAIYVRDGMQAMEAKIKSLSDDRYTVSMAAEHALRQAIENPGFRVPDPRNPGQVIVVAAGNRALMVTP